MHVVVRQFGATTTYKAPLRYESPRNYAIPTEHGYYQGVIPGDVQERPRTTTPTTAPTTVPRTSTTPTSAPSTSACADLWSALLQGAPGYIRNCINTAGHRAAFNEICGQIARGQTTLQAGSAQWAGYVDRACPPPPPQTVVPPPTAVPPIDVPTTQPPPPVIDVPTGGDPGGGGPADAPTTEESRLRQVGSVVGIGLILAVGLTYARKKGMLKLTKRRRRR